jgi:Phage phiEco32-like COOH.NH2 ligase-type 2
MNMMKITIGCDPELFVTQDGKFRSAHGLIPGTKEAPFRVENGAVQVDGMALEYNIDPVDNADDFVRFNQSVMEQMRAMVPGYEFAIVPSCKFNGNHFRAQPDEAKELGCMPDFNAYTGKANPRPDNKTTMRTASGHVHIGFCDDVDPNSDEHMVRCATLIKQLDCYLGLPSLLFDNDVLRRKMYGAAGAFRPKSYGVEYRVLSNAWLLTENRMRFVFDQTVKAVNDLLKGVRPADKIGEDRLIQTINRSDAYSAEHFILNTVPNGKAIVAQARAL